MLTLKKIEHSPRLSEETMCFSAEVYWEGRYLGIAENRGNGGDTWLRNYGEQKNSTLEADLAAAQAWAKTQPVMNEFGEQEVFDGELQFQDLEGHIDALAADWIIRRDLKRKLARDFKIHTKFSLPDGRLLVIKEPLSQQVISFIESKYAGARILNKLPIEEAISIAIEYEYAQIRAQRDNNGSN